MFVINVLIIISENDSKSPTWSCVMLTQIDVVSNVTFLDVHVGPLLYLSPEISNTF